MIKLKIELNDKGTVDYSFDKGYDTTKFKSVCVIFNGKLEVILENGSRNTINIRGIANNADYSIDLPEERWENALERQKKNKNNEKKN